MIKDVESVTANLDIRRCRETKCLLQIGVIVPVSGGSLVLRPLFPNVYGAGLAKLAGLNH